MFSSIEGNAA